MFNELWEDFKRAIVPKSHAEAMVDELYGPEARAVNDTFNASPYYTDWSMYPQFVVKPAATVIEVVGGVKESVANASKKFGNLASDTAQSLAIWLMAFAIVFAIVYALARK